MAIVCKRLEIIIIENTQMGALFVSISYCPTSNRQTGHTQNNGLMCKHEAGGGGGGTGGGWSGQLSSSQPAPEH